MKTTHDYTQRYWGHDYVIIEVIDEGQKLKACGWGNDIEKGDYLILENNGNSTRYRVKEIRYANDPRDMWFATLEFAPRPISKEKVAEIEAKYKGRWKSLEQ